MVLLLFVLFVGVGGAVGVLVDVVVPVTVAVISISVVVVIVPQLAACTHIIMFFITSFMRLSADEAYDMATDPVGSRLMETYLRWSRAQTKHKKAFMNKFEGSFAEVCFSTCFVVDVGRPLVECYCCCCASSGSLCTHWVMCIFPVHQRQNMRALVHWRLPIVHIYYYSRVLWYLLMRECVAVVFGPIRKLLRGDLFLLWPAQDKGMNVMCASQVYMCGR